LGYKTLVQAQVRLDENLRSSNDLLLSIVEKDFESQYSGPPKDAFEYLGIEERF
jgi:hypothetical protein